MYSDEIVKIKVAVSFYNLHINTVQSVYLFSLKIDMVIWHHLHAASQGHSQGPGPLFVCSNSACKDKSKNQVVHEQ